MTRRVDEGVRIVDLLVDRDTAGRDSPAFPVEGLAAATAELVTMEIESPTTPAFRVNVPTLERAFLLRCLAVVIGPDGLKFVDYVDDAVHLARLVHRSADATRSLAELSTTSLGQRARDITLPLFADSAAPGSRAVSARKIGDGDLAARQVAALLQELLGRHAGPH